MTVPAGSLAASACTNDWIPPLRGGKSLVTIRTFGIGFSVAAALAARLAAIEPRRCGPSDLNGRGRACYRPAARRSPVSSAGVRLASAAFLLPSARRTRLSRGVGVRTP